MINFRFIIKLSFCYRTVPVAFVSDVEAVTPTDAFERVRTIDGKQRVTGTLYPVHTPEIEDA